jgi:hypothetical protein
MVPETRKLLRLQILSIAAAGRVFIARSTRGHDPEEWPLG